MSLSPADAYDELPYEDNAYYHTHPSNLAVVSSLCGLTPPRLDDCRVLELGCGSGFNLLAMAQSLPNARFVGVDLSPRQIEHGRAMADSVGCDRVELHALDVAEFEPTFEQFDYIIAHGLFSWVPLAVQQSLLALFKRHLAPGGIAYVSYNTYPGWNQRSILRDILRFHMPKIGSPLEKVRAAKAGLERLVASLPDPHSDYARFLRSETEALRTDSDIYLFHEFLVADNQPMLFEKFSNMASYHGLRFLAEARFGTNSFVQPEEIKRSLDPVSDDILRQEQQLDFLRNRFFRQTLLCHEDVEPTRSPTYETVGQVRLLSQVESLGPATGPSPSERFRFNGDRAIQTSDPIFVATARSLQAAWPRPVAVAELVQAVSSSLSASDRPPGAPMELLVSGLAIRGYVDGLWLAFAHDPPFASAVSDRPRACPLARLVAETSNDVTNRLHRPVHLSPSEQQILRHLDGRTTCEELAARLKMEIGEWHNSLRRLADQALLEA